MRIEDVAIREILTANSQKTIEIEVKTKKGANRSSVPVHRNGIYKLRYLTNEEAIKKFLEIKRHFVNNTFDDINDVDSFLKKIDISADFREIGGNLAYAISSAMLKALAQWNGLEVYEYLTERKPELPVPLGIMTDKQKSQTDFQEYLLYPERQKFFTPGIMKLSTVFNEINSVFGKDRNLTMSKILKTLSKFTTQHALEIGINFGATNTWNGRRYTYSTNENLTTQEQLLFVQDIAQNYPVGYLEDPFHEEDFVLFATLTHRLPTRTVAGNELYSNNRERIKTGTELKSTSGIVLRPSEMGTVTDFIATVKEAKKNKMVTVIDMMREDTDDLLMCHLAAGTGVEHVKTELIGHSVAKINELVRIEGKIK